MSDLQADLSLFEGDVAPDPGSPLANIVEAARRVANPDYEASMSVWQEWSDQQWAKRLPELSDVSPLDPPDTMVETNKRAVDAALGVTRTLMPTELEMKHALEVLEHGRQTHIEWIDYLENENPEFDTEHVGDVEHHRWYLTGYEPAIEVLKKALGVTEDE